MAQERVERILFFRSFLRLRPIDPYVSKLFRPLGEVAPALGAFVRMGRGIADLVDRLCGERGS